MPRFLPESRLRCRLRPLRGMLLAPLWLALAVPPLSAGTEDPPQPPSDESIFIECRRPEAPGEPLTLRLRPGAEREAVLVLARRTDPQDSAPAGDVVLVPLPVDPASGEVVIEADLPEGITWDGFAAEFEVRVATCDEHGTVQQSDPLPLADDPSEDGAAPDPALQQAGSAAPSEAVTGPQDDDDGEKLLTSGSGPGGPGTAPTGFGLNAIFSGNIALRILSNSSIVAIHDQPTPIQGSGH